MKLCLKKINKMSLFASFFFAFFFYESMVAQACCTQEEVRENEVKVGPRVT